MSLPGTMRDIPVGARSVGLRRRLSRRLWPLLPGALARAWTRHRLDRSNWTPPPELVAGASLAAQRGIAIDVGANVGWTGLWLRRHFAVVHLVEAHPELAVRLARIAAGDPGMHVHALAAGSASGTGTLHVPRIGNEARTGLGSLHEHPPATAGPPETWLVKIRALDSLTALHHSPVGLIKIDVEGTEAEVLDGAAELVRHHHPVLVVEVKPPNRPRVFAWLENRNYRIRIRHNETWQPLDPTRLAAAPEDWLCLPPEALN